MDSILPFIDIEEEAILEDFDNVTEETTITPLGKALKFDFTEKKFIIIDGKNIKVENVEQIKQWIDLILLTYKDKVNVYNNTDFYCNVEDLIGQKLNIVIETELKLEIKDALLKHRCIDKVQDFKISQIKRTLTVEFTVILKDNSIININQNL
ncbi:DUF2634 domain-containing protein [Clostridium sp. FP1]|uniref:DUF2634 domain-containing protein n=1 Tax=Clostridium sp. FP1 TaxID=2724076 RepID=UPI0013E93CD4|nr:DUF2634 domain-containing protein [Clostridium sp. FP1]MBZ9633198.1 DUF2634 domain-containing protein [Clostridium sp. FP1]